MSDYSAPLLGLDYLLHNRRQLETLYFVGFKLSLGSSQLLRIPTLTTIIVLPFGNAVLPDFHDEHLRQLADTAPNLSDVFIGATEFLTDTGYTYLAQKCPKLRPLRLHGDALLCGSHSFIRSCHLGEIPNRVSEDFGPSYRVLYSG